MKCPFCQDIMVILELNQIEVDYCTSCNGIWLDSGELELLLDNKDMINKLLSSFHPADDRREKKLKCPICRSKMKKISAGEPPETIIDHCPNEHGFWFDFGELNKLADYAASGEINSLSTLLNDVFSYKLNQLKGG